MKYFCFLLAALLGPLPWAAAQTPNATPLQQALRAGRDQRRFLLVGAPSAEHPDFKRQKALLAAAADQLQARDLRVLDVFYDQLSPTDHQLAQRLGLRPPAFGVVLVGKDGGAKRTSATPLAPDDLFGTVDKMPMRRQEMRRRGQ
ncbi:DUF4174 domain-containing protein [Hymenobacter sp. PAMC 26628]|uniref:DUF4174 domain-containing protein n=1 Tax=Hymenobacter sp. PAMC 26628 TaxID=1484118 RepID=UPI00076FE190|nr:DUF4174 domain-containing protein [Hymenobacter sp. PAMC 26628]AMJ64456.1 hypothetical protein AXW84_02705 [Hymenobacter sp. PAMC 26628]